MRDFGYETDLVRALLEEQHPDLAALELTPVVGGWGNQQFRLGQELAVRMPRTPQAPDQLRHEQKWLPQLAERLPLPVPAPVRVGEPSELFEHTWSVVRWVQGEPADREPITDADSADALGEFLRALHHEAPDGVSVTERGAPRLVSQADFERWLAVLGDHPGVEGAREVWQQALAAPVWRGPPQFVHADLHPANVVVRDGSLAGVIDFGDLGAGDPAADLSAAWILLPGTAVERFLGVYQRLDDGDVARARGWAVLRALTLISIGQAGRLGRPGGKPTWEPAGFAALERVLTT